MILEYELWPETSNLQQYERNPTRRVQLAIRHDTYLIVI